VLPLAVAAGADHNLVMEITRSKVEAAARSLGFAPVKPFTMPDGRTIWIWWRERGQNQ
jgi:hypothetical protein